MHVPELRTASRRADRAAAAQWREERRAQREEGREDGWALPLQLALVTDGSDRGLAEMVRAGGADVVGLLAPEALESLVWAAEAQADHGYSALDALAADAVDAACLDLPLAESCRVASAAARGRGQRRARPGRDPRAGRRALVAGRGGGRCVVLRDGAAHARMALAGGCGPAAARDRTAVAADRHGLAGRPRPRAPSCAMSYAGCAATSWRCVRAPRRCPRTSCRRPLRSRCRC